MMTPGHTSRRSICPHVRVFVYHQPRSVPLSVGLNRNFRYGLSVYDAIQSSDGEFIGWRATSADGGASAGVPRGYSDWDSVL